MIWFKPLAVGAGLALLLTTTLQPAIAQSTASSPTATQELVRITITPAYLEELYAEAATQAVEGFQSSLQDHLGRELTASEFQRLYQFWDRKVRETMPYEALERILAPIFSRQFTPEEIAQINQFYHTPTGAKLMRLSPNSEEFTPEETAQITQFQNTPTGAKLARLSPALAQEARNASDQIAGEVMLDQTWLNRTVADLQAEFPEWFR